MNKCYMERAHKHTQKIAACIKYNVKPFHANQCIFSNLYDDTLSQLHSQKQVCFCRSLLSQKQWLLIATHRIYLPTIKLFFPNKLTFICLNSKETIFYLFQSTYTFLFIDFFSYRKLNYTLFFLLAYIYAQQGTWSFAVH